MNHSRPAGATASALKLLLAGGLGGAINAWLCYAKLPVPIEDGHYVAEFAWHVVPAGAGHGALLAAIAVGAAALARGLPFWARLLLGVPVGWIAGYFSWVPLNRSAFDRSWPDSLTWVFSSDRTDVLLAPLSYFGLVGVAFYLSRAILPKATTLSAHVLRAIGAGSLGSLWFWIAWQRWYFGFIHGAIWGLCVGIATWRMSGPRAAGAGSLTNPSAHASR